MEHPDTTSDRVSLLSAALEGRYTIERRLGDGGMADVYLAHDLRHDREVALKVLKPELAAAVGVERFLAEIRTTANLRHPHILPLFDSGEADGLVYYVMPYVDGESLRERLQREGPLPIEEAIRIVDAVGNALEHAHDRGVVHRDIKPANILFQDGEPIVADFGIALAIDAADSARLTSTGLAVGSIAYMSPEQATDEVEMDGRADVYSLGCVLFEMLTGEVPFGQGSHRSILLRKLGGVALDSGAVLEPVPVTVREVIRDALAPDPADRVPTPRALAEALHHAVEEETIERRARRRRRTQAGRALGLVAGLAAVGGALWWGIAQATAPSVRRLSVLPPVSLLDAPDQEPLIQGMHNGLIDELSRAGVGVIGSVRSMMRYRDTDMTVPQIAGELDVDAVLESAVFWAGDSVGVDVRLLDGDTEAVLWTGSYVERTDDVLRLYRSVTAAVASEIRVALTPEAEARLAESRPVNPAAYEAYLRAQFYWNRMTPQDFETALEYLDVALREDPDYAPAYAGVAWIRVAQQQLGMLPPTEATPLARAASEAALRLDSESPEVQYARGVVGWATWDWEEAEAGYRRAIELNPNFALARGDYSHLLSVLRRPEEALEQIERAVAIDPPNIQLMAFRGMILMFQGRDEETIDQMGRILERVPDMPLARSALWDVYQRLGNEREALANAQRLLRASGLPEAADALTESYDRLGYQGAFGRAADIAASAAETRFVAPMRIARLYRSAGRYDDALDWLERGFAAREPNIPYIGIVGAFSPLRENPRFQALLEALDLPGA